jgi:hypothetical protein
MAERPTWRCAARPQPEPRIGASVVRGDSGVARRFQRDQTRFSEDPLQRAAEAALRGAAEGSSPGYLVRWAEGGENDRADPDGRPAPRTRTPILTRNLSGINRYCRNRLPHLR